MNLIGRFLGWLLLCVNGCLVLLMWACALSPYVNPAVHPVGSCAGLVFPAFLAANGLFFIFWLIVCRRYAWLPLIGMACCFGTIRTYVPLHPFSSEVPPTSFKILSYNTMSFGGNQPHTKDDPNPVLEYLRNSDADIICLQEYIVGRHLRQKEVDDALRDYPYKHYYKLHASNGLGCYSRFPILSAHPVKYASANNGSIAYRIDVGGDTLLVVNNHLESNKLTVEDKAMYRGMIKDPGKENVSQGSRLLVGKLAEASALRAPQADSIARWVSGYEGKSVIVCGDFNDSPVSYTHRIVGRGLDDAFVQSGNGLGISYNQNRFYFRIDHIFLSKNFRAYRCTVDRTITASDHYPVWCYVAKK